MKQDTKNIIFAFVLSIIVVTPIIYLLIEEAKKEYASMPTGAFVIIKKEIRSSFKFFPFLAYDTYVFYYDSKHFVEVFKEDYYHYSVGDLYPHNYTILH